MEITDDLLYSKFPKASFSLSIRATTAMTMKHVRVKCDCLNSTATKYHVSYIKVTVNDVFTTESNWLTVQ